MTIHIDRSRGGNLTAFMDDTFLAEMPEDDVHSALACLKEQNPRAEITVSEELAEEL